MADSQSKIDAAAEKAFADAAEKKTADSAKQPVDAKAVEKAVDAGASAPVKADAVAKAVAAEPAPKAKASAGKRGRDRRERTPEMLPVLVVEPGRHRQMRHHWLFHMHVHQKEEEAKTHGPSS